MRQDAAFDAFCGIRCRRSAAIVCCVPLQRTPEGFEMGADDSVKLRLFWAVSLVTDRASEHPGPSGTTIPSKFWLGRPICPVGTIGLEEARLASGGFKTLWPGQR